MIYSEGISVNIHSTTPGEVLRRGTYSPKPPLGVVSHTVLRKIQDGRWYVTGSFHVRRVAENLTFEGLEGVERSEFITTTSGALGSDVSVLKGETFSKPDGHKYFVWQEDEAAWILTLDDSTPEPMDGLEWTMAGPETSDYQKKWTQVGRFASPSITEPAITYSL